MRKKNDQGVSLDYSNSCQNILELEEIILSWKFQKPELSPIDRRKDLSKYILLAIKVKHIIRVSIRFCLFVLGIRVREFIAKIYCILDHGVPECKVLKRLHLSLFLLKVKKHFLNIYIELKETITISGVFIVYFIFLAQKVHCWCLEFNPKWQDFECFATIITMLRFVEFFLLCERLAFLAKLIMIVLIQDFVHWSIQI